MTPSPGVTVTEQGVLQPGPSEVRASAPAGVDSSWTWMGGGADLKALKVSPDEKDEQPARLTAAAAIARTRRMIDPLFLVTTRLGKVGP